jgi:hypothetical protein
MKRHFNVKSGGTYSNYIALKVESQIIIYMIVKVVKFSKRISY